MTDKAAFDLYALLRETENEQSNLLYNEPSTSFEEGETTDVNETTQPATTSIVTTVPTTTTTTTTTTPPPPPSTEAQLPGRGRYRGGVGGRNKFRAGATSTQSTTPSAEVADESATKRGKFSPNRNRDSNQVSPYGRRGSKTTPSPDQSSSSSGNVEASPRPPGRNRYRAGSRNSQTSTSESPATSLSVPRPSFSADRYNSRRRGSSRVTTTAPVSAAEAEVGGDSEAGADDSNSVPSTARPNRPRLSIGGGVRPLRPGPKINIGGRARLGAQSTTTASVSDEPAAAAPVPADISDQPDIHEQTAETTTAQPDALTRLRNRPRLHVGAKAKPVVTQGPPTNRKTLVSGLLPRRKAEVSTEITVATEEAKLDEESETAPTVLSTTELATPQDRLSSLVGGRRRLPGRRPGPLSRPISPTE